MHKCNSTSWPCSPAWPPSASARPRATSSCGFVGMPCRKVGAAAARAGQAVRASETGGLVVERADGTVRPLRRRDVEPGNAVINPGSGVVGIEGLRDAIREHEEQIPFRPGLAPEGEGRDFSRGEVDK